MIVDTTVQPKNVMSPTDARLLNRAREKLVRLAKLHGVALRQSYARVGKFALIQHQRYAHAKQFNRANDLPLTAEGKRLLPIPATYVVDTGGLIALAFVDADYRNRLDPAEIVRALQGLRARRSSSAGFNNRAARCPSMLMPRSPR
jgi:hypothetical protein